MVVDVVVDVVVVVVVVVVAVVVVVVVAVVADKVIPLFPSSRSLADWILVQTKLEV